MSGGRYEYVQYRINDIIDYLQDQIDKSGQEIPIEDRWMSKDYYEKYPEEAFYTKHSEEVLKIMKEAIGKLKESFIFAQRLDWYLSGDDGEESLIRRLNKELKQLKHESKSL